MEAPRIRAHPEVDTRRLAHLLAAVRHRSLTEAAATLELTQPALTRSIQALERAVGGPLLERGRFGVRPTALGEALAAHAEAIEDELRQVARLAAPRRAGAMRCTLGCGPSEATRLLPLALDAVRQAPQAPQVTVLYGLNESLMPMVKSGEIDFALSSIPTTAHDPDLDHEPLHVDTGAVVARSAHPLAARRSVRPADLLAWPWVLARRRELERRALDQLFLDAGLRPIEDCIETTSAVLMKTVALQTDHLSFLPREMIHWEERAGLLVALKVPGLGWTRTVGLTWRRGRRIGAAAEAVAQSLRTAVGRARLQQG